MPLIWTKSKEHSYESFIECVEAWEEKAETDPSIDLREKFYFDALYAEGDNDYDDLLIESEQIVDRTYLEFYSEMELKLGCSGMCS